MKKKHILLIDIIFLIFPYGLIPGGIFFYLSTLNFTLILKGELIMNTELRRKVKELKVYQNITYTEIAEYLEVSRNSFYNWLNGYYELSLEKENRLNEIIGTLKE